MTTPGIEDARSEMKTWGRAAIGALEVMIKDIRAGKYEDDTLEKDFGFLYHLMGRRRTLAENLRTQQGRHRGPGTPGYVDLGERE